MRPWQAWWVMGCLATLMARGETGTLHTMWILGSLAFWVAAARLAWKDDDK